MMLAFCFHDFYLLSFCNETTCLMWLMYKFITNLVKKILAYIPVRIIVRVFYT